METKNKIKDSDMKTKKQIQRKIEVIKRLDSICDPNDIEYRKFYEGCIEMLEWVISKEPITHIDGHGGDWDYNKEEYVRHGHSTEGTEKVITLQQIIEYFEIDLDNCYLDQRDFCKDIYKLISNPEKEISNWEKKIEEYYEERDVYPWKVEQQPQSTKRSEQFKRLSRIQESGYNVVNCGDCGIPVIVSIDSGSDLIECHECGFVGEHCDYPDVVCEGC